MTTTREELERYHDGELPPDERAGLSERLRGDHELRGRLAEVAALDERIVGALLDEQERPRARRPARRRVALSMAAAVALLVVGAIVVALLTRAEPVPPTPEAPPVGYERVRVVMSIPIAERDRRAEAPVRAAPTRAVPIAPAPTPVGLDLALVRGDVDAALRMIESAGSDGRASAYRRLGSAIRSAATADSVLDRMDDREQLEVCRQWAGDPHLRPVTFQRLRRLGDDPALAEEVRALAEQLAEDPRLRPWVRSYRLVTKRHKEPTT